MRNKRVICTIKLITIMKKHITFLTLLLLGTLATAQNFEAPRKGAKIFAQEYSISLEAESETTFDLWIVRSRMAKKAEFLIPTLRSSSGLAFEVKQDTENVDHYVVTVSAKDVDPGQYTTIVSSKTNGTHQVTGTTLSFNITPTKTVASKDGE